MLKLEAGKRYWRRDGGVSGPLKYYSGYAFCFRDEIMSWKIDGAWCANGESPGDLVREYTDPQPLQWKRGIPTEEECRECWIVTGRYGNRPDSFGKVYAPSEVETPSEKFCEKEWYVAFHIQPVEPPKPKTKIITLQQFTHTCGDKRWMVVEDNELSGCWTATNVTKTVEVPCE